MVPVASTTTSTDSARQTAAGSLLTVVPEMSQTPERATAILRASYSLRLIISAVVVAVTVATSFVLPFDHRARLAILIMAGGAFLQLVNLSVLPILQVQLRMQWSVFAAVMGRLVTLVATLAVLAVGLHFKAVVTANVIGLGVILLVDLYAVRSSYSLRPTVDVEYWKRFLKASAVLGVGLAISQIYFRIDTVLIALLRPAHEVGLYGAAYKFVELTQGLVFTVFISMFPTLTSFAARRDARFTSLAQKGFDVVVPAALPLTLAMVLAARPPPASAPPLPATTSRHGSSVRANASSRVRMPLCWATEPMKPSVSGA